MEIIGVIGNYKTNTVLPKKVRDIAIKNITKALMIVGLDESFIDKDINKLTLSEKWKIDLLSKLEKKTIVIGSLSNVLNYKDQEYIKKVLIKIAKDYNKRIVVIDNNVNSFFNLVSKIYVVKRRNIVYETEDFFDLKLYKYVNMPKIIDFINEVNKDKKKLSNNIDIYELIKDIYRVVS